jgi:hypothetical protein
VGTVDREDKQKKSVIQFNHQALDMIFLSYFTLDSNEYGSFILVNPTAQESVIILYNFKYHYVSLTIMNKMRK